MAKVHHIFIIYDVLTNNFHTHQLFTSSSPRQLPIVFPILAPPFLPSPPPFLAISDSLSSYLLRPVMPAAPVFPTICSALSYYLRHGILPAVSVFSVCCSALSSRLCHAVLLSSPQYPASCPSLSYRMRHAVLVSHMPRTCKHFSPLSNPAHTLQRSRKGPSTSENMPFLVQEKPLLDARKASPRSAFINI